MVINSTARISPRVTIVTPTYNQEKYIAATIESVLAQDYSNIEYIVIDDGSTDGTPEILEAYATRAHIIRQENAGQAATINRGLSLASGEYFGYLSSDDLIMPNAISELVRVIEADAAMVCAFPDADLIDENARVVKRHVCREFDHEILLVKQECHIGPGALFRTELGRKLGGWRLDLKLAPDREFWLRLADFGHIHFVGTTLSQYRLHQNSISYSIFNESSSREYLRVLDDWYAGVPGEHPTVKRRSEAYGNANFIIARNCLRSGSWGRALDYYRAAVLYHPPLLNPLSIALLVRSAASKYIRVLIAKLSSVKG